MKQAEALRAALTSVYVMSEPREKALALLDALCAEHDAACKVAVSYTREVKAMRDDIRRVVETYARHGAISEEHEDALYSLQKHLPTVST